MDFDQLNAEADAAQVAAWEANARAHRAVLALIRAQCGRRLTVDLLCTLEAGHPGACGRYHA